MQKSKIDPHKITSPIQLMAAWFVMLILLSGVLLEVAIRIKNPEWAAGYLVISTSILIAVVIIGVFLMLTIFRPNLQDGKEYSEWLREKGQYGKSKNIAPKSTFNSSFLQEKLQSLKETNMSTTFSDAIDEIEESVLYKVSVLDAPGSRDLIQTINTMGYVAELYEEEYEEKVLTGLSEQEAIWVGSKVPAKSALEIIKRAIRIWPHLKYIHLSSDASGPEYIDWEIFLGGSSSTARKMYKLAPWSNDEIQELHEDMDQIDFHSKIRTKYS